MPMFPSASGYTGMEATPLARIGYSDIILSKIYEEDWLVTAGLLTKRSSSKLSTSPTLTNRGVSFSAA